MRHLAALACALLFTACATTTPVPPQPGPLLHDTLFAPPGMRIDAAEVFALDDSMRRFITHDMARSLRLRGQRMGLVDALYNRSQLRLEYDAAVTRNAAQAFEARAGNCLSLVIMTAAFAKALDIPVQYQVVLNEDTWTRDAGIVFTSGHVNLALGRRATDRLHRYDAEASVTIDFLPAEQIRGQRTRPVSEATVVAMYMNNRAAESLAQGRIDDAYWWARAALLQAPGYTAAYNTLAVVYLRRGHLAAAEPALRTALQQQPAQREALSNLVQVLQASGRGAEAQAVSQQLAKLEPHPPYHFFDLGMAAMQRGEYAAARSLFERELARADYHPQFHFGLAMAHYRLGDFAAARRALEHARDASANGHERELYAAKLTRLGSVAAQQ